MGRMWHTYGGMGYVGVLQVRDEWWLKTDVGVDVSGGH